MSSDNTIPVKRIRCPKCGNEPSALQERWRGHVIDFDLSGARRSKEGTLNDGSPCGVSALCDCGHVWTLRGVAQITDLDVR